MTDDNINKPKEKNINVVFKSVNYEKRFDILRVAQANSKATNYSVAIDQYWKYLNSLAIHYKTEPKQLSPEVFNYQINASELLLIAHAYWDLAKIYDMYEEQVQQCDHCLQKFSLFTKGFRHQQVNELMVEKYLRTANINNLAFFKRTLKEIESDKSRCYIATFCFGEGSQELKTYRSFRDVMAKYSIGRKLIKLYYSLSPSLVNFLIKHPRIEKPVTHLILRPFLKICQLFLEVFKV